MDNADQMFGPDKSAEKFCKVCGFVPGDILLQTFHGKPRFKDEYTYELLAFDRRGEAILQMQWAEYDINLDDMRRGTWTKVGSDS